MAKVTMKFVGVGAAWSKKYGHTSCLVTVENGGVTKRLLIDCGGQTPNDLDSAGIKWTDIDAIFITHVHGDHVHGLEEAGFVGRYTLQRKPHLILPSERIKTELWNETLKGTMAKAQEGNLTFRDYFTFEIVDRKSAFFDFNGVMFSTFPTYHVKNKQSYGLFIGEGQYIMYSGDTLLNPTLVDMAMKDGMIAMFHDCGFYNGDGKVHASLDDLTALPADQRDRTYIMHYPDNMDDRYDEIRDTGLKIALLGEIYEFEIPSLTVG